MGDRERASVQGPFLGRQTVWPEIATSFLLMDKNGGAGRLPLIWGPAGGALGHRPRTRSRPALA